MTQDAQSPSSRTSPQAKLSASRRAAEGPSCNSGRQSLREAAKAAGMNETLDRYARDYPVGPHDQPQSMCPAFGALRVGLRMRRTASVLSGSACCVYGLTFTSHFYGAKTHAWDMCRSTPKRW